MFYVKHLLLVTLLIVVIMPAFAQKMYRCPSAGGGTSFSDTPCTGGQGGEITVKPSSGTGGNAAKPDPQTRGAMDKRAAEFDALLSPECRRARQAFQAKAEQKGGMDELMKEGNPISKAWEDCQFAAQEAQGKLQAKDQERIAAEERKMAEQHRAAERKDSCTTKRKVIADRQARYSQLSDPDRAVLQALELEVARSCR